MGKEDWYRNTTWTPNVRAEFFERFNRSRSKNSMAQYLRIQAYYLSETEPKAAEELLSLLVEKYPEPSQLASTYHQLATLCLNRKDEKSAVGWFRKVIEQQSILPSAMTNAHTQFALLVVMEEMKELYEEVREILLKYNSIDMFPIDSFLSNGCLCVIADHLGDKISAKAYGKLAVESMEKKESQFRYHRKVGLVSSPYEKFLSKIHKAMK